MRGTRINHFLSVSQVSTYSRKPYHNFTQTYRVRHKFLLIRCLPDSAWVSGNLAEWALLLGKHGITPKSKSTKDSLRADA